MYRDRCSVDEWKSIYIILLLVLNAEIVVNLHPSEALKLTQIYGVSDMDSATPITWDGRIFCFPTIHFKKMDFLQVL